MSKTALPMVVCKCALRFSKGIEPRRAKEAFRSFSKIPIEFLFGEKETKIKSFVGTRTDRNNPSCYKRSLYTGVFRSLKKINEF